MDHLWRFRSYPPLGVGVGRDRVGVTSAIQLTHRVEVDLQLTFTDTHTGSTPSLIRGGGGVGRGGKRANQKTLPEALRSRYTRSKRNTLRAIPGGLSILINPRLPSPFKPSSQCHTASLQLMVFNVVTGNWMIPRLCSHCPAMDPTRLQRAQLVEVCYRSPGTRCAPAWDEKKKLQVES